MSELKKQQQRFGSFYGNFPRECENLAHIPRKRSRQANPVFTHMACVYLIFRPSTNNSNVHRISFLFVHDVFRWTFLGSQTVLKSTLIIMVI